MIMIKFTTDPSIYNFKSIYDTDYIIYLKIEFKEEKKEKKEKKKFDSSLDKIRRFIKFHGKYSLRCL